LAKSLNAEWFAVHVDLSSEIDQSTEERLRLERHLELARELGATIVRLSGNRVATEVANFARSKNISLIIVGYSRRSLLQRLIRGSVVSEIIKKSSPAQVLVTEGFDLGEEPRFPQTAITKEPPINIGIVLLCSIGLVLTTTLGVLLRPYLNTLDLAMIFLLFVSGSAIVTNMWEGIVFAAMAVIAFDFFTVPPYNSFSVSDLQYVPGFIIMFFVGVAINALARMVQKQARVSKEREAFMTHLSDFSVTLLRAHTFQEVLGSATRSIGELFDSDAIFLLPDHEQHLQPVYTGSDRSFDEREKGVAAWVFHNKQPAGFETNTLAASKWHHVPLIVSGKSLGVLAVAPHNALSFGKDRQRLLHAYVNVISLSLLNSPVTPMPDFEPR
jgi:two-component system sensor histidine kinase KdpD